jgi:hypothetical protein
MPGSRYLALHFIPWRNITRLVELAHASLYCFTGHGLGGTPSEAQLTTLGIEQHKMHCILLHTRPVTAHPDYGRNKEHD